MSRSAAVSHGQQLATWTALVFAVTAALEDVTAHHNWCCAQWPWLQKRKKKKTRVNWPAVILGSSPSMPSCLVKYNQTYSQMHCPKLVLVFVRLVPDLFQDSSNSPRPKSVLVCSSVNVELDGFCFSFLPLTWQQCPEIEHNICSVNNWTWNPC